MLPLYTDKYMTVGFLSFRESLHIYHQRMALFMIIVCVCLMSVLIEGQTTPCDDEIAKYCPNVKHNFHLQSCLKGVTDRSKISSQCEEYILLHDVCKDDINTRCPKKEYTKYLKQCLLDKSTLSEECDRVLTESIPRGKPLEKYMKRRMDEKQR